MSEETQEQPTQEQETPDIAESLFNLLKTFNNAPSAEQVKAWKAQYGDIFVSGFSETEIFVWRTLRRPEFIRIQTRLQNPSDNFSQYDLEDEICETCVLWKSISSSWKDGKGGTPQSLSEQIMQNSHFMSPQAASILVAKL